MLFWTTASSAAFRCTVRTCRTTRSTTTTAALLRGNSISRPTTSNTCTTEFLRFQSSASPATFTHSSSRMNMDHNDDDVVGALVSPDSLLQSFRGTTGTSPSSLFGNNVADAMYALYKADAVCFDVDSTVISEEGIDVLAEYLGKGEQVAALTKQAMEGGMKFQDALQQRLDLLRPSRSSILQLLQEQPMVLTPHVDTLMNVLQEKQVDIWLVSGGFRIMIEPTAEFLKIPKTNIVANTILFDESTGDYIGFDPTEPTSQDMGKPKALQTIQNNHSYQCMVMVGDGATDAQAKPPAKAFIGFGGVVQRPAVQAQADWFVHDFMDMVRIVEQRE